MNIKKHKIDPIESDINNLPDLSNTLSKKELTSMYPSDINQARPQCFVKILNFNGIKLILNKKNNCIMNQTSCEKFNLPYDAQRS